MSFDLGFWSKPVPKSAHDAGRIYSQLCRGEVGCVDADAAVAAFLAEVIQKYPDLNDYAEESVDECPWNAGFDHSPGHVIACIAFSHVDEILPWLKTLAAKHRLVCFDPQSGTIAKDCRNAH